jgi:hypothetical protein
MMNGMNAMYSLSNGKNAILELNQTWRDVTAEKGLSGEMIYRIEKLILRLDAVADKIYIKTVKAHEILHECVQLTEQFRSAWLQQRNRALILLTRLEDRIDDLVQKAYTFRVKAG